MAEQEQLNKLISLIDGAKQLAVDFKQPMAAYILSIASLEVSQQLEHLGEIKPPHGRQPE